MANWPTPHLFAWFGTESCYLAMAAMRPRPVTATRRVGTCHDHSLGS